MVYLVSILAHIYSSCFYFLAICCTFFLPFIGLSFDDVWISQCDSIREWLSTARRPLTVQRYAKNLGPWFQFLDRHDLHQYIDLSPTGSDDFRRILIWFLHFCAVDLKLSESKVQTTIQALQYALKTDGYSLNVFKDDSIKLARAAVRGDPRVKHAQRTRKRRLPVTFDMLSYLEDLLLQSPHLDDWMTYLGILMAFHFMLRVSEYCLDGSSPHAIRCGDVLFLTDDGGVYSPWDIRLASVHSSHIIGAIIDLRSSKADKAGKGRHLYVSRGGSAESFLLDLMIFWSTVAEFSGPAQAFLSHAGKTAHRRKHLTRRMVSSVLKQMAAHFGFDDAFFSTHSLRIGGMSCGTKADMNNATLCRIGGWSSDSEARYRENVPDSGILSVLDAHQMDTTVSLLSSADVRRMLPTSLQLCL